MTTFGMAEQGVGPFLGFGKSVWNLSGERTEIQSITEGGVPTTGLQKKKKVIPAEWKTSLSLWSTHGCTHRGFFFLSPLMKSSISCLYYFVFHFFNFLIQSSIYHVQ